MTKRFISLLLAFALVFTSANFSVFAEERREETSITSEKNIGDDEIIGHIKEGIVEDSYIENDIHTVENEKNAGDVNEKLSDEKDVGENTIEREVTGDESINSDMVSETEAIDDSIIDKNELSADINDKNVYVIVDFPELEDDYIYLDEKLPLDELLELFPTSIIGICEDETEINIEVTWKCNLDYENELYDEYVFNAVWDDSLYTYEGEYPLEFVVPSIYVMIDNETIDYATMLKMEDDVMNLLTTSSDDAEFEVYLANYYLNSGKYYVYEYESPYRTYVENLLDNDTFQKSLAGWRMATFDLSSEFSYSDKEYAYCEAILFDVLYQGDDSLDLFGNVQKDLKVLNASAWKKLAKLDIAITENPAKTLSVDEKTALLAHLGNMDLLKESMDYLNNFGDLINLGTTAAEVVENVCKVQELLNMPEEVSIILKEMGNSASSGALKYSLQKFSTICTGQLTTTQISAMFSGETAFSEISKLLLKAIWKGVVEEMGTAGLAVQVGQAFGKYASNLLVGTDKIIENYYTLRELYEYETILKTKINSYANSFKSNPTYTNAKKLNIAIDLLYKTYKVGIDYSIKFVKACYEGGAVGWVYKNFRSDEYTEIIDSMNFIKKCFEEYFDYAREVALDAYKFEHADSDDMSDFNEIESTGISTAEFSNAMQETQVMSARLSNLCVTSDMTLTSDMFTYGNLYVESGKTLDLNGYALEIGGDAEIVGNINLNGGTLIINGDVLHTYGTVKFNKGTMKVGGNYRLQNKKTNSAGEVEYAYSSGYQEMQYDEDLLEIAGSYYNKGIGISTYTAGTIKVGGDLQQLSSHETSGNANFKCEGTHKVILNGNKEQRVSMELTSCYFNQLEIQNPNVMFGGHIGITTLLSDANVKADGLTLGKMDINGHHLTIDGDVKITDNININAGILEVKGDVLHTYGTVKFNKGTMKVGGNYRLQNKKTNSAGEVEYTYSSGSLVMQYDDDLMEVSGNFYNQSSNSSGSNRLTAGTMKFGGNIQEISTNASSTNFCCSGTHKTILIGEEKQEVSFESSSSYFNILQLTKDISNYTFTPNPCWITLIEVEVPVSRVELSETSVTLEIGESKTLTAQILPSNADVKEVSWSSSNSSVITVEDGVIKAVASGTAEVVAEAGGVTATCVVTVNKLLLTVSFDLQGAVGEMIKITDIESGSTVTMPENPTKDGYVFSGWFTEKEGKGTEFTSDTVVTESITVYAYWVVKSDDAGNIEDPKDDTPPYEIVDGDLPEGAEVPDGLWISEITPQIYTGSAIKPEFRVYDGTTLLAAKKDYTYSYKNNTKTYETLHDTNTTNQQTKSAPKVVIKGQGNYRGTVERTFIIEKKDITDADIAFTVAGEYATGTTNPSPTLKYGKMTLKKGVDYTVTYYEGAVDQKTDKSGMTALYKLDKKAAGIYTMVITSKGNYDGTLYHTFNMVSSALMLNSATIIVTKAMKTMPYTGEKITIDDGITVKIGEILLTQGKDYKLEYENNTDAGKATVKIVPAEGSSYCGSKSTTFSISGIDMNKVCVTGITQKTYNGKEQTQNYSLSYKANRNDASVPLIEGIHYTVEYINHINKGTATVKFTGKGNYTGTVKKTFKIAAAPIISSTIEAEDASLGTLKADGVFSGSLTYIRGGVKPKFTITVGDMELTEGTDYIVKYANNNKCTNLDATKIAYATATISGKGNYNGSRKVNFIINKIDISNTMMTAIDKPAGTKKGTWWKSTPVLKDNGISLKVGTDYERTFSYSMMNEDGEAVSLSGNQLLNPETVVTVTVTGKGNYTGTKAASYKIGKINIGSVYVSPIGNQIFVRKNTQVRPEVIIYTDKKSGTSKDVSIREKAKLTEGEDYIITYKNNTKCGKATITITGKGEYVGTKDVTFRILPKRMAWFVKK